jgi:hypothetical protein
LSQEDLGMLFIPDLHVLCKIYKDSKGMYIHLPSEGKQKQNKLYYQMHREQILTDKKQAYAKKIHNFKL